MRDLKFWQQKLAIGVYKFLEHKKELSIAEKNYATCTRLNVKKLSHGWRGSRVRRKWLSKRTMWHSKVAYHKREMERLSVTKLSFYEKNVIRLGGKPMLERIFLDMEIKRLSAKAESIMGPKKWQEKLREAQAVTRKKQITNFFDEMIKYTNVGTLVWGAKDLAINKYVKEEDEPDWMKDPFLLYDDNKCGIKLK